MRSPEQIAAEANAVPVDVRAALALNVIELIQKAMTSSICKDITDVEYLLIGMKDAAKEALANG